VAAVFDADPDKVGREIRAGLIVMDISHLQRFISSNPVELAVLAVPARVAQTVLDQVGEAGIPLVLNFVPARLKVPAGVRVQTVDLKVQVESLVFHLPRERAAAAPGSPETS
ncbi:MAG: redox-sensing transcriptional repressor Rex, partial [Akkermansiaceae bacterium]|nr:redox-sensing transcriptional repressor Rex [Akkermansiaceae bacterium]